MLSVMRFMKCKQNCTLPFAREGKVESRQSKFARAQFRLMTIQSDSQNRVNEFCESLALETSS